MQEINIIEGKDVTIRCPFCDDFHQEEILRKDFNITFFRCKKCKKPLAYRDNALIEKLDAVVDALKVNN